MATTILDVLDGTPVAMVVTMVGRRMSARPVTCAALDASCVTFLVHRESEWVKHVEGREAIVHLTFADDDERCWVSLEGSASSSHDPSEIRRLWRAEIHGDYFAADDPDVVVVRFDVTDGECWSEADRHGVGLSVPAAPPSDHEQSRAAE